MSDIHWRRASIPKKSGALGIRRSVSPALPAFLASAVATSDLQSAILSRGTQIVNKDVELAHSLYCSLTTTTTPVGPFQTSQRAWDAPMVVRDCQNVLDNATSDIDKARLLAVKADHGSEWIFALPISACSLRISNEAVRIAIGLRLGLNICEPHSCPCGGVVDAKGIHGLSCKRSAGRSIRHQQINDLVWRALRRADTRLSKNRQVCSPERTSVPTSLH